jgi:hypothetical protein
MEMEVEVQSRHWSNEDKVKKELFVMVSKLKRFVERYDGLKFSAEGMLSDNSTLENYYPSIKTHPVTAGDDTNPIALYFKAFVTLGYYGLFVKAYSGTDRAVISGDEDSLNLLKNDIKNDMQRLGYSFT